MDEDGALEIEFIFLMDRSNIIVDEFRIRNSFYPLFHSGAGGDRSGQREILPGYFKFRSRFGHGNHGTRLGVSCGPFRPKDDFTSRHLLRHIGAGRYGAFPKRKPLNYRASDAGNIHGNRNRVLCLVAAGTPDNKLSYALGVIASSNFIGSSIGPFVGGLMAEQFGYRISFFAGSSLLVLSFLIILIAVKEENKPKWSDFKEQSKDKKENSPVIHRLRNAITPLFFVILVILFFVKLGGNASAPYISIFVQEIRGTITGSSAVTGTINGAVGLSTALAGLTIGRLGDRISKRKILYVLLAGTIFVSLPLYFISRIVYFTLVYCFLFYLIGSAEPILMSLMSENTPKEKRGMAFGIYSLIANLGWAASPVIGSAVTIAFGTKTVFLCIPAAFFIALLISLMFLKEQREKIPS